MVSPRNWYPTGEKLTEILGRGANGDTQGYAHVGFASLEGLQAVLSAHEKQPFHLRNRNLRLEEATTGDRNPSWNPDPERKSFRKEIEPRKTLFVSGFDVRDTEKSIREAFDEIGDVHDVELCECISSSS